ncbi:diaminopimelate dehydrogenase [Calidifontibacillus erzurumensis]|uniref:Meso-diaminopimelate D-dehydrogenase n=1 Tax=Calidifontibacillus erzurumensis TaxID=2741433 RepID=A0A8J8GI77_9BACI|nr:diaminopimelate dehydrogenase [Calidifontibacillus erzurumensis]NSL52820.1 diaminopimelate dehydrogenase [Calidifontibacillus erzurumensis]
MGNQIRLGIVGYGNIGRGVQTAVKKNSDMVLSYVFTRRNPETVQVNDDSIQVLHVDEIEKYTDKIDVLILCGGSATDLPEQGPQFAKLFNTVDSFDTHARIPEYFEAVDAAAKPNNKTAIISVGWDPGLFSLNRVYGEIALPQGSTYTFWGKGLSQGHSDAIRRVPGVKAGVQYTIPIEEAVQRVRNAENPELTTREKHIRECWVVPEEGANLEEIETAIKTMPNYFADYDTIVNFITEEELKANHSAMPHGGFVIRSGQTSENTNHVIEYSLKLDSNPEFTASVLVAYARAAYRMNKDGQYGAKTVFDVAPGLLSPKSAAELRKELL